MTNHRIDHTDIASRIDHTDNEGVRLRPEPEDVRPPEESEAPPDDVVTVNEAPPVPVQEPHVPEDLMTEEEVVRSGARQSLLIDPKMRASTISIVGCGMVGSWTSLAMIRAVSRLNIWDADVVEMENLGCQAYDRLDVGTPKVNALSVKMSGMRVVSYMGEMPPDYDLLGSVEGVEYGVGSPIRDVGRVVVMAVDSMLSRREIVEWVSSGMLNSDTLPTLLLDARVYGELATCIAIDPRDQKQVKEYLNSLPDDENTPDAPCGEEGTAYTGMWAASRLVAMVNNHFRNGMEQVGVEQVSWHVGINMSTQGAVDKVAEKIPVFGKETRLMPPDNPANYTTSEESERKLGVPNFPKGGGS